MAGDLVVSGELIVIVQLETVFLVDCEAAGDYLFTL
jgi:hypothetical protein